MTFNAEAHKRAILTQIEKYGGPEGYAMEMRRRQSMRKTHGTGGFRYMKQHHPERFKQIIAENLKKRGQQTENSR